MWGRGGGDREPPPRMESHGWLEPQCWGDSRMICGPTGHPAQPSLLRDIKWAVSKKEGQLRLTSGPGWGRGEECCLPSRGSVGSGELCPWSVQQCVTVLAREAVEMPTSSRSWPCSSITMISV